MAYYVDIFSPETYDVFSKTNKSTAGFHEKRRADAMGLKPGDKLIGYVTRISRWIAVLEVTSNNLKDDRNFLPGLSERYNLRIDVKPAVWLPLERGIPMTDDILWNHLSFTRSLPKNSPGWTTKVRKTLTRLSDEDGEYLYRVLVNQSTDGKVYELSPTDIKKLQAVTVKTSDNIQVTVTIPEDEELAPVQQTADSPRESIKIQALLAEIGERMAMKIWVPKSDKQRVLEVWKPRDSQSLLTQLPLNYDDATLKTIENIDVLWIRGRSIIRAFEVEHTTSIYSGLLRMADLMALQPNLNIVAYIVAPEERKEKVFDELTRPVFTYLEKGPLRKSCSFLSYDSVKALAEEKRLEYMTVEVLGDFAESADEPEV